MTASVTVVVPAYSAADTIERCLASIAAQATGPAEIILVDDGSTDGTADIALATGGTNLKVERLPENGGPGRARNVGVQRAATDWIAFLDADDEWLPELLERAIGAATTTGARVVGCGGIRIMLERDGARRERRFVLRGDGRTRDVTGAYWRLVSSHGIRPLTPSGMLVRRDVLLGLGGFPEDMQLAEDTVLSARLWLCEQIVFVDRALYRSAQGSTSLSTAAPGYADTVRLLARIGAVLLRAVIRRRPGTRWLAVAYPRMAWQRHRRWLDGRLRRARLDRDA